MATTSHLSLPNPYSAASFFVHHRLSSPPPSPSYPTLLLLLLLPNLDCHRNPNPPPPPPVPQSRLLVRPKPSPSSSRSLATTATAIQTLHFLLSLPSFDYHRDPNPSLLLPLPSHECHLDPNPPTPPVFQPRLPLRPQPSPSSSRSPASTAIADLPSSLNPSSSPPSAITTTFLLSPSLSYVLPLPPPRLRPLSLASPPPLLISILQRRPHHNAAPSDVVA